MLQGMDGIRSWGRMNRNDIRHQCSVRTYIRCCQSSSIFVPHHHLVFRRARSVVHSENWQ